MDALSVAGPTRDVVIIGSGKSELEDYVKRASRPKVAQSCRSRRRKGLLLSLRPFQLRASGRADGLFRSGRGSGEWWPRCRRARRRRLSRNTLSRPKDEYDPNWDWTAQCRISSSSMRSAVRARRERRMAELVPDGRISRDPRQVAIRPLDAPFMPRKQPPEWARHDWVWIGFSRAIPICGWTISSPLAKR
jgi:hypothetical protein